jgi:hypothetical protein
MQPCTGGYVRPFCLEEALLYILKKSANFPVDGTVTKTKGYTGTIRDDYASNWVKLPDRPKHYPIVVKNLSADSSFFWSVACDLGDSLRVDIWAPLEPGKTANLGVDRSACVGPSYVTITNHHMSAPNPDISPKASYKVWVPYSPIAGTLSWTVAGSSSGVDGNVTWDESWTENGSLTLALTRDPVNYADYLVVDNGSNYQIDYSLTRTEHNSFTDCTTTFDGLGSGSGSPTTAGFMGTTWPNWDPPDPADAYPDVLGIGFGAPFMYAETWGGDCAGGQTDDPDAVAPYYHGLEGVTLPVCVPPALSGVDPSYWNGWTFAGAWNEAQQRYEFACSKTLPVPDGSQTVTVSGTANYPSPP